MGTRAHQLICFLALDILASLWLSIKATNNSWYKGKQRFGNTIPDRENHRRDADATVIGATVLPRAAMRLAARYDR